MLSRPSLILQKPVRLKISTQRVTNQTKTQKTTNSGFVIFFGKKIYSCHHPFFHFKLKRSHMHTPKGVNIKEIFFACRFRGAHEKNNIRRGTLKRRKCTKIKAEIVKHKQRELFGGKTKTRIIWCQKNFPPKMTFKKDCHSHLESVLLAPVLSITVRI